MSRSRPSRSSPPAAGCRRRPCSRARTRPPGSPWARPHPAPRRPPRSGRRAWRGRSCRRTRRPRGARRRDTRRSARARRPARCWPGSRSWSAQPDPATRRRRCRTGRPPASCRRRRGRWLRRPAPCRSCCCWCSRCWAPARGSDRRGRDRIELLHVHAGGARGVGVPRDPEVAGAVERHLRDVAATAADLGLQVLIGCSRGVGHGRVEDLDALGGVARDERRGAREHAGGRSGARARDDERRSPGAVGVAERRRAPRSAGRPVWSSECRENASERPPPGGGNSACV